jgi:hypothetical protein
MYPKCKIWLSAAIFLLITLAAASDQPGYQSSTSNSWDVNLTLRSAIYLPTPRPVADIYFVLNNSTPNLVYRIERGQADDPINSEKMAYATTNATPHDVYKIMPNALGPFPKGKALGFTLRQWLGAIGTGTYIEENNNATLNLTFHKLVPNGTYSIWVNLVTMPPNYRYSFTPVGASDGSENVFKADAKGTAMLNLKLKPLPSSTNVTYEDYVAMYVTKKAPLSKDITWTLIAVAYNSDGRTHGAVPGELGKTTHFQLVHLMYPKPIRTYQEWKNVTGVAATAEIKSATAPAPKKQIGFEIILAITGLLVASFIIMGRKR